MRPATNRREISKPSRWMVHCANLIECMEDEGQTQRVLWIKARFASEEKGNR